MAEQDFTINIRTTADLAGVRRLEAELAALKNKVGAGGGGGVDIGETSALHRIEHGFIRPAFHMLGAGLVFEAIAGIGKLAEAINQVTESLDKQGESLVRNSREMIKQAKFAETEADVLKTAEEAQKNIAEAHAESVKQQQRQLTVAEKGSDLIAQMDPTTAGAWPNQERLERDRDQAARAEKTARAVGVNAIAAAEREKQRREGQTLSQDIDEITQKMQEAEARRESFRGKPETVADFAEASQEAEKYRVQLGVHQQLRDKEAAETVKDIQKADPQVQRILQNEEAARKARAEGREKDAELYTRQAEQFKSSARPEQLQQLGTLEKAINDQNVILGQIRDAWR